MGITSGAKAFKQIFVESFRDWQADKAPRLGAALAYYTVFSIAPLLLIVIGMVGFIFGRESVQQEVMSQVSGLTGGAGASAVEAMLKGTSGEKSGIVATIIGFVVLFLGASGVFAQLQDALDTVWGVRPSSKRPFWAVVKDRWISFTMVLGIGFLLLVSLVISALLSLLTNMMGAFLPIPPAVLHLVNIGVSFAVLTLLFAMIFKYLPNVEVSWRNVWTGAAITAVLFTIGKYLIGLYLGHSAVASSYGAAGAVIILMLWAYYSSQILLFGAELTQAVARYRGAPIVPAKDFVVMTAEERGRQRIGTAKPSSVREQPAAPEQQQRGEAQMKKQIDEKQKETAPGLLAEQEKVSRAALMTLARDIAHDSGVVLNPKTLIRTYPLASLCAAFVAGLAGSQALPRTGEPALKREVQRIERRRKNRAKRLGALRKRVKKQSQRKGVLGSAAGALLTAGLKLALGSGPSMAAAMLRSKADHDLESPPPRPPQPQPGPRAERRFEHRTV